MKTWNLSGSCPNIRYIYSFSSKKPQANQPTTNQNPNFLFGQSKSLWNHTFLG